MRIASDTDPRAILAISPFASPDARLIASICEAGALCVLDLGADPTASQSALVDLKRWTDRPFGLRVGPACGLDPTTIRDSGASLLLLAPQTDLTSLDSLISQSRQGLPADVLVEVRDLTEARAALNHPVSGIVSRGSDSGGLTGDTSSFVLLQELLNADLGLPIWAAGGIGPHTVRAVMAAGAAGILLDTQLALLEEATIPTALRSALRRMDGSESTSVDGYRVLRQRPKIGHAPGCTSLPQRLSAEQINPQQLGVDPERQWVPVGQDGFLARRYAERWGDVTAMISGLRAAMNAPSDPSLLLEASPLAQDMGTRLPLAQGPMTRVSDQPEFAASVAAEGGLPFIALAMSSAEQSRTMLKGAQQLLADQPWGGRHPRLRR
ncbi:nitronate monooxygenase [Acaricomes phytoseiuli]|uniref:nitronate monooxygenase n=1 Tax=Acaricomes phytoseiuli TaxID=291968 RepID=UPI0003AA4790|nr:nitronate monooxygenase [Acaricomes phytoseiuli]